jgi:hypothetical protein
MAIPFLACMAATAAFYHLPPRVLPAIQAVEGGRVGVVHVNTDGTEDLGVMQVNTRWIKILSATVEASAEATRARLIQDACFNIAASGAILRTYLNEAEGDLMLAVGYYHSHTPVIRQAYLARVMRSAAALFGRGR